MNMKLSLSSIEQIREKKVKQIFGYSPGNGLLSVLKM
jgi:hypothetical protein